MGPPTDLARALDAADDLLHRRGSLRGAREAYDIAFDHAERAHDSEAMARAALGLGGLWVHERRASCDAAFAESRQQAALAAVGPASPLGLRLRVRLAAEADYRRGGRDEVLAALDETRRSDDAVAVTEALSLAHHCLLGPDHARSRTPLAEELLRVAARSGRPVDALMGLLWGTVDHYLAGDPMADRTLAELRARLAGEEHQAVGFVASALEVMLAIRAGRLAEAESLAEACARAGEAAGDADATGWYAGQLTVIRWYQGRSAELVPHLTALAGAIGTGAVDVSSFAALAVGHAAAGDAANAACALARVRGDDFRDAVRGSSWLVAMCASIETAYLLGDAEAAAAAYAVLLPYADLPVMLSLGVACLGSAHHSLGVAALTTGDLDRAVEHLRRAVRANQALGHLPATALSRHRLGQALSRRDAEAEPVPVELERRGPRGWSVRVGDRSVEVPDGTGMRYLAVLAERPGDEVAPLDLVRTVQGPAPAGAHSHTGSLHAVLDHRALREYRTRLAELDAELAEATRDADLGRADSVRAEREWLLAEVAAATGMGGQVRSFTDDAERARIAVTKAIRRSVERVAQEDAALGAVLAARVRTGSRCCLEAA